MKHKYPIKRSNRYLLPGAPQPESLLFHTLPSLIGTWFKNKAHKHPEIHEWHAPPSIIPIFSNELQVTWIGHATFLIQIEGFNIITDPIFTKPSLFFPRLLQPGIHPDELPPIDIVLISHNHRDHMDAQSLMHLYEKHNPLFFVPEGDEIWFLSRSMQVESFTWWQEKHHFPITFSFLPAYHWSQRGLFDKNKSLWGSWLITAQHTSIYFAGDTSYGPHFKYIREQYPIDIALLPIAPCEPHAWMCRTHLSGDAVAQSFLDLAAEICIPMHWGTFGFGYDNFLDPIHKLRHAFKKYDIDPAKLYIAKAGERLSPTPAHKERVHNKKEY